MPVSFIKILLKLNGLSGYGQVQKRASNSNTEANSPIWPKMELVQDFMPDLIICKLEEDLIKPEGAIMSTTFFPALKGR